MFGVHKTMKIKVCVNDIIAATAVLLLALAIFLAPMLTNTSAGYVKITSDSGEQLVSIFDNNEYSVNSNGYAVTIKIEDREAFVSYSTCPDKVCVNSGKISRAGEVIVCAPALVSVEILGEKGDADYVVG